MTATMQKTPATRQRDEGPRSAKLHNFSTDLNAFDHLVLALGNIEAAEQMQKRAVQDMLTMATAHYWERRAEAFDAAMPRPDDFHGNATPDEIAERAIRCKTIADQCRAHARILRGEFDV